MTMQLTADRWRDEFVLSRDARALGRHSELVRDVRAGRLVPVVRGVYRQATAVTTDLALLADDAYLARVRATQLLASEPIVYAGLAAAAIWGLPMVGSWPERVATLTRPAAGGRSNGTLTRSYVGDTAAAESMDGLLVTALPRTVVDVGRVAPFLQAVVMADAALHGQKQTRARRGRKSINKAQLKSELKSLGTAPGVARCRGVISFADGASGSAGESVSRVGFRLLGLPMPLLQVPFFDHAGLIGYVDFFWPQFNLVGEFDGKGKYLREEFLGTGDSAGALLAEKDREDRLRALDLGVTRWGWDTALSTPALRDHLARAGVR